MENDNGNALLGAGILGIVFLFLAAAIGIRACAVADKATFGRMDQEVDTQNYYRSTAYREGLRRDCDELSMAYHQAVRGLPFSRFEGDAPVPCTFPMDYLLADIEEAAANGYRYHPGWRT